MRSAEPAQMIAGYADRQVQIFMTMVVSARSERNGKSMDGKPNIQVEIDPGYTGFEVVIKSDSRNALVEKVINAIEHCIENEYTSCTQGRFGRSYTPRRR